MKTPNVSIGITRDDRVSNHHTARTLDIENKDGNVGIGVSEKGKAGDKDALEVGQKRRIGGIEIERKNDTTLIIRDATLRVKEIPLASLESVTGAGERQVLANFAAGIAQAAKLAAPPVIASELPMVQAFLDQGFAANLARIVKGEAGAKLSELKTIYENLEQIEMTPKERVRLAELEVLTRDYEHPDRDKLNNEKWDIEEKKPKDESMREVRRLILQQIDASGLPDDKRAAVHASEAATKETPAILDLLKLMSGELYLPHVSGALQKNILAAEEGRVWISGADTPNPYSAATAFEPGAIDAAGLDPDKTRAYKTELALWDLATRFEGPDDPKGRFELMRLLGTETLHRLRERFDGKGDGGFYAQRMIAGMALAKPEGVKSLKEFLANNDTEVVTKLAYAYNGLLERAGNGYGDFKGIDPAGIARLVSELRFDQFAKLLNAHYSGDGNFGHMLVKHGGVDGLIKLAKRKSTDELVAMAKEARGKETERFYPAPPPPADAELAAKIAAPPFEEVVRMARALGDCGLSKQEAKELHAIVERHLVPDYEGKSKGGGYTLEQMNQFWSSWPGSMGVVTPTVEHISAYQALTTLAGHYIANLKDRLAVSGRTQIVEQFAREARAKPGEVELINSVAHAVEAVLGKIDGEHEISSPKSFAKLLTTLADKKTGVMDVEAAIADVEQVHRMQSTSQGERQWHSLKTELGFDKRHKMDVNMTAGGSFGMRIDFNGGPRREDFHSFAELQAFGDGARWHFGAPLLDGDHPVSKEIGARIFAESLPLGVPYLLKSNDPAKGEYERRDLEAAVIRSAIELARLPEAMLQTKVQAGEYETPAAAIAALANKAGYKVDAKTLDQKKLAELGAQVWAGQFTIYAPSFAKRIVEQNRDHKEVAQLMVYAFDALRAMPAADREKATRTGTSVIDAMKTIAGALKIELPPNLETEKGWRELEGRAYAALFMQEAHMLTFSLKLDFAALLGKKPNDRAKERAEAAGWAERLAGLEEPSLAQALPSLKEVADLLKIEHDGTAKDIVAKLRVCSEKKVDPRTEIEDQTKLAADMYVWIVPDKPKA